MIEQEIKMAIKCYMAMKNMKLKDLARELDCSVSYLSLNLQGKRKINKKILDYFGVQKQVVEHFEIGKKLNGFYEIAKNMESLK